MQQDSSILRGWFLEKSRIHGYQGLIILKENMEEKIFEKYATLL